MLLANGNGYGTTAGATPWSRMPVKILGGASGITIPGNQRTLYGRGDRFNRTTTFGNMSSTPDGANHPAVWQMAYQAGRISSRSAYITVASSAAGVMGLPAFGYADITLSVADADGQLISSGTGTASFAVTTNLPSLTASLNAQGNTSFSIYSNSPILGAEASLTAFSAITFGGSLIPYAIGSMSGNTENSGVLTTQAISAAVWEYVDRTLTAASSSSLTTEEHDQLMKTLTTSKFLGLK